MLTAPSTVCSLLRNLCLCVCACLIAAKGDADMLFDEFDAGDLNKLLKSIMDGLSVKVIARNWTQHILCSGLCNVLYFCGSGEDFQGNRLLPAVRSWSAQTQPCMAFCQVMFRVSEFRFSKQENTCKCMFTPSHQDLFWMTAG